MSNETPTIDHEISEHNQNSSPLEFISEGNQTHDQFMVIDKATNAQLGIIRSEYDGDLEMLTYHGYDMKGEPFFYPTLDMEVLKGRFIICKDQLLASKINARRDELKSIRVKSLNRELDNSLNK
ncbi:hypothetical protein COB64_04005 [Candidatus Wolfebacteria bacterium]|nr:MAG: hypothetical protein COB64_04005 [Candidatus Wolfebacteria bacterium]